MRARTKLRIKLVRYKVAVRRNAQHIELNPCESTRFALITVVMVAVSTSRPNGCPVSLPPLSSQNIQSHEKAPASHRAQGEKTTISLTLGASRESKDKVKDKASRVQSSRIGSALVFIRRNAQHRELNLPESTRFALITLVVVAGPTSGHTGCPKSPYPLSSQNIQSHEKALAQAIEPGRKHQPGVLRWARIVRARRESRVRLVGYKVAE